MTHRALLSALSAVAASGAIAACGGATTAPAETPATGAPSALTSRAIHHVFLIVLENEDAGTTFSADSPAPYLTKTLRRRGAFIPNYYGIGHHSLSNYLALISGQAPTLATQADCPTFTNVRPGSPRADGQVFGQGCVYPASVPTLAGQLQARGMTWKGYMEDMGDDPARDGGRACAHPAIGAADRTQSATADDQYATRHNPFVYFHSIIDKRATCAARDVPLTALPADLARVQTTPNLSFITPDLCHDGHDDTCADGGPGGLAAADAFLRSWIPRIAGSPAFRRDGLLIVTFDEGSADGAACCGERHGPNTMAPGGLDGGAGGGRVGAVMLSPFTRPGTTTTHTYNHYSLLRSIEDAFGLPHLGYAAARGLRPFGGDLINRR
ncbi:alkaline phosphatase family protein [Baekduia sp.]|jgi:hypothetical protein|uniref:alkaline phosphatase family protein n=1 Tax=Baekduia sp. TaxID=2600305 RepID=UPI002DFABA18|nr:alkaline phosphatase family protein [Baekduia sp.]